MPSGSPEAGRGAAAPPVGAEDPVPAREAIFFDDLREGQVFTAGPVEVTSAAIKDFGRAFDPQAQHVDEEAARATTFGGLAASGWHTAALCMRLTYDAVIGRMADTMGLGVDALRWHHPVRPGDRLGLSMTVTALRTSRSKPGFGIVSYRSELANAAGEAVMTMMHSSLLRAREAGPSGAS